MVIFLSFESARADLAAFAGPFEEELASLGLKPAPLADHPSCEGWEFRSGNPVAEPGFPLGEIKNLAKLSEGQRERYALEVGLHLPSAECSDPRLAWVGFVVARATVGLQGVGITYHQIAHDIQRLPTPSDIIEVGEKELEVISDFVTDSDGEPIRTNEKRDKTGERFAVPNQGVLGVGISSILWAIQRSGMHIRDQDFGGDAPEAASTTQTQ